MADLYLIPGSESCASAVDSWPGTAQQLSQNYIAPLIKRVSLDLRCERCFLTAQTTR